MEPPQAASPANISGIDKSLNSGKQIPSSQAASPTPAKTHFQSSRTSIVFLETPFVPKTSVETSVEQKYVTSARSSEVRATSSGTKQHRKRNRSNEDIEKMSQQLGEVAAALNKISANKLDINQLHEEIMKIEGYSEEFLDLVFDHLVQNEKLGKALMAKSQRLRLISLERFKKDWGVE
ncbi:uncharacterized protein LOC113772934 [Coffea eugenioides]|uniref:uncharacterized protein LOC113772934 n=1 Tax=Coffea eugenioides TaxID=49369 RepID=UPI000F611E08|nr:uncharacterized protein LOC113772934 [Coffea eugenioides]